MPDKKLTPQSPDAFRDNQLQTLEEYLIEVIGNIRLDRATSRSLLMSILTELQNSDRKKDDHADIGIVAAKYLETLQRSNEQFVKLLGMFRKKDQGTSFGDSLDENDAAALLDKIQQEKNAEE